MFSLVLVVVGLAVFSLVLVVVGLAVFSLVLVVVGLAVFSLVLVVVGLAVFSLVPVSISVASVLPPSSFVSITSRLCSLHDATKAPCAFALVRATDVFL